MNGKKCLKRIKKRMPKGWTITTKEGETLSIEEWLGRKEEKHGLSPEFSKLQEKEVKNQRKCFKRRVLKNEVLPEYEVGFSEVRHLTKEEIEKEYKMPLKEGTISERGKTIRELIKFLQELEGRKVSTDVIVQRIKKPGKSVSSFLSQLFNASIVVRRPLEGHKRKFVWGLSVSYLKGDLEAIISTFNEYAAKRRKDQYLKSKEKISMPKKEEKKEESSKRLVGLEGKRKLLEGESLKKSGEHTLKVIVEGNIKILFGLAK